MAAIESELAWLEEHLGGAIPSLVRHFMVTESRGQVLFEGTAHSLVLYGHNRAEPRMRAFESTYGALAAGVLPIARMLGPSSEIGIYLPTGHVIDLHGEPDRPRQPEEYGDPFRGEWRIIASDFDDFLMKLEGEGLFFIAK